MASLLTQWTEAGLVGPLGHRFAQAMGRLAGESDGEVLLACALAAEAPLHGDVCLDFNALAAQLAARGEGHALPEDTPDPEAWRARVATSPLATGGGAPLVLSGGRLYLARYHQHQSRLAHAVAERAGRTLQPADPAALRLGLQALFPDAASATDGVDRQQLAALVACLHPFAVITGGPGTGKTTTVVRLLALLLGEARAGAMPWPPRIALLAPTGKAAARMTEAVRRQIASLPVDEAIRQALPTEAATLHRALGARPDRVKLRHDARNPLTADVVVVDEASMVDLAMMARLFDALRPGSRLILLGDRDQLASVEAGSVLGDLCAERERFSPAAATRIARYLGPLPQALVDPAGAPGVGDTTVNLVRTWRFDPGSDLGALAAAVNAGQPEPVLALLADPARKAISRAEPEPGDPVGGLRARAVAGYKPLATATDPAAALEALGHFRVLCAHRGGPLGVRAVGQRIERWLAQAGLIHPEAPFYAGRPVMVLRNDYAIGLFNGDVGVTLPGPEGPRVWFPQAHGDPRPIAPARLPPHETVYATTVHKAQGSEFE
ncbi:MAG: exodeoxyribonuclease V subunit alpha, partial [Myxococcales bacterium]|nr:exodeoxyribonuclease V subunit alpha [Myxococcales bacterium]